MSPAERIAAAKALADDAREIAFERREKAVESLMIAESVKFAGNDASGWVMAADYAARTAEVLERFADLIAIAEVQQAETERLRALTDELDFIRHEGGPQSVAAMEAALRAAIPVMRRTAAEYLEGVMIRHNPDTIAPSEWAEIAPDLEAILAAEAVVGRLDDDDDRDRLWLNSILDVGKWRAALGDASQREGA